MVSWKNLDTYAAFDKLTALKGHVDLVGTLAGETGGERVKAYQSPMAGGLLFSYAAREVDEDVLEALAALAEEAQLIDKF